MTEATPPPTAQATSLDDWWVRDNLRETIDTWWSSATPSAEGRAKTRTSSIPVDQRWKRGTKIIRTNSG